MLQRVFVDANIFRSKTQMDWMFLLRAEFEGSFQTHSTEDVIAEASRSWRRQRPDLNGGAIYKRIGLIRRNLDEVLSDYQGDIPFSGKDKHDRHVHSAATACRADLLLTGDNPTDITTTPDKECYEVISPDQFFLLLADTAPEPIRRVASEQEEYWRGKSDRTIVEALKLARCPHFALRVEYEMTAHDRVF